MVRVTSRVALAGLSVSWLFTVGLAVSGQRSDARQEQDKSRIQDPVQNAADKVKRGRRIFRFDTFGDQAFWGGTLKLHQAIEGARLGGVGSGVSPRTALAVGLKIDADALPHDLLEQVEKGRVNLDDPAGTLALLRLNAVLGITGEFNSNGTLKTIGIQCALCHSTVDDSHPALCAGAVMPNPGTGCIGHRLDGWPNRDLNVGAIVAVAPGATLIPPAFGLGGVNLHTWTGWGSVPHWNAFVATLEMHGVGRFFDPRLDNAAQFPIAAMHGFGDLPHISPDDDQVTSKLSDLQFHQLSIPSPEPRAGSFDPAAAKRGDDLFSGKAGCNNCHVEPLWSDPGWNLHSPSEVCVDAFQADRAPDRRYRTSPIGAIFTHTKGGFFHDGRFLTLDAVVDHYNTCFHLGLSGSEKRDLIQYLLSLTV